MSGTPLAQRFGVTDPISLAPPTPKDEKLTKHLEQVLKQFNLFESSEESQKREEALGKLNVLVKEWAKKICLKKVNRKYNSTQFN
jgi:poly(A) polymerase